MTTALKIEPAAVLAAYVRVSTDAQADRDTPLMQRTAILAFHAAHPEFDRVEWYQDPGVSGSVPLGERPEGARLLSDVALGRVAAVVCYADDRLHRDAADSIVVKRLLRRRKVPLYSTGEGRIGNNPLMDGIRSLIAEEERRKIGQRTQDGTHGKVVQTREEGGRVVAARFVGGIVALGYRVQDGWLLVDEDPIPGVGRSPAEIVRHIFRLVLARGLSCVRAAEQLNKEGVPTTGPAATGVRRERVAAAWTACAVRRLLVNSAYWGVRLHGVRNPDAQRKGREWEAKPVERRTPAIVTPEEGLAAARALRSNFVFSRRRVRETADFALRGLLRCAECGHGYCGAEIGGGRVRYTCTGRLKGRCDAATVEWDVSGQIRAEITQFFLGDPRLLRAFAERRKRATQAARAPARVLADLRKDLARVEAERERLVTLLTKGVLDEAEAKGQRARLKSEQAALEARVAEVERESRSKKSAVDELDEVDRLVASVRAQLSAGELDDQAWRRVLQSIVVSAEVRTVRQPVKVRVRKGARAMRKESYAVVLVEFAHGLASAFEAAGVRAEGTIPAAMLPATDAERAENLAARQGPRDDGKVAAAMEPIFTMRTGRRSP